MSQERSEVLMIIGVNLPIHHSLRIAPCLLILSVISLSSLCDQQVLLLILFNSMSSPKFTPHSQSP